MANDDQMMDVFFTRFNGSPLFFLNPISFRKLSPEMQNPMVVSPRLLDAMQLWIRRIVSGEVASAPMLSSIHAHRELWSSRDSYARRPLHDLQTEILLSYYCLDAGLLQEGRQRCEAAVTLCSHLGVMGSSFLAMDASLGQTDEIQRAFWAVLLLSNLWVVVSGLPAPMWSNCSDVPAAWPESNAAPGISTICTFLRYQKPTSQNSTPPCRLLLEASMLFERITSFCERERASGVADDTYFLNATCHLEAFHTKLPGLPTTQSSATRAVQMLLVVRCLAHAAMLRLHTSRAYNVQHQRAVGTAAARFIEDTVIASTFEWSYAEPILGPIISMVCDICVSNADSSTGRDIQSLLGLLSHRKSDG
ncbi:hypothetical protein C8F01DRAFT_1367528 [Mycena amicta]|nr:hypothetical protein C8F01DRAFT_1367528 [Mycena amicta]